MAKEIFSEVDFAEIKQLVEEINTPPSEYERQCQAERDEALMSENSACNDNA